MRALFVAPPFFGLLFPVVPLAHALRAAGHEVLLATCGPATADAARAGLTVLDCAPEADPAAFYRFIAGQGPAVPGSDSFFGVAMADRLVDGARDWRPDVVVHPPQAGVARLAATALGVPSVVHGLSVVHTGEHLSRMSAGLADAYRRHGLSGPDPFAAWLDVIPPSLRTVDATGRVDLRPVPYNGGGVLPGWLLEPVRRPRVTVTLGTVNPKVNGLGALDWVRAAATELDAEFVLALGDAAAGPGELPDNVRSVGWVPLGALLATSDAVVHHGGAGTMLTAVAAGLPQLIVPGGADQLANADAVDRRGNGLRRDAVTVADVRELLADGPLRAAAGEVRAELATMPSPAELADVLFDEYLS